MARWWSNAKVSQPVSANRFRPRLEAFEERWVPDGGPNVAPDLVTTPVSSATVVTTTITLDFSAVKTPGANTAAVDTITINITPAGVNPTKLTVDVPAGSTPAQIATAVAENLKINGFNNAAANGSTVVVTVTGDATTSTVTHLSAINGAPTLNAIKVSDKISDGLPD